MTPAEVFEALRTDEVTDYHTRRGTREGCGQCCSRFLPMSPAEAATVRLAARRVDVRPEPSGTVDLMCPLLTDGGMCAIYDVRPAICRAYDCAAHARRDYTPFLEHGIDAGWRVYDVRELVR